MHVYILTMHINYSMDKHALPYFSLGPLDILVNDIHTRTFPFSFKSYLFEEKNIFVLLSSTVAPCPTEYI